MQLTYMRVEDILNVLRTHNIVDELKFNISSFPLQGLFHIAFDNLQTIDRFRQFFKLGINKFKRRYPSIIVLYNKRINRVILLSYHPQPFVDEWNSKQLLLDLK